MNIIAFLNTIKTKSFIKSRIFIIFIILLLIASCFLPVTLVKKIDLIYEPCEIPIDGQILFSPWVSTNTYLIDNTGDVKHTWSSNYSPGSAVWWLGNGTILRTIKVGLGPGTGGAGGGVQIIQWDGTLLWDFRYTSENYLSHHDVKSLPNGNVLLIAWEIKNYNEAIAAGRNPNILSDEGLLPDHIIEVKPTGPTAGEIVWKWHVWDHLIQDYDPTKENFGVVAEHPELVDINYVTITYGDWILDWMHTNSIDYNEEFDQIIISVRNFNEIWVIDHSTTTEEASGHIGGNSGRGGDILYRWGNPEAYQAGTVSDRKLFYQHDASWIKPGCPGAGNILVFNNGCNRPKVEYSSVDEIVPPVDSQGEYYIEQGGAFGPDEPIWIYTASPPSNFYSSHLSGAQRLPSGNTLICDGEEGIIFEATPEKETVWQYINPYPNTKLNELFKVVYIPSEEPPIPNEPDLDCSGGLEWINVKAGEILEGNFQVKNIGDAESLLNWSVESFPGWGDWSVNPESGEDLTPEDDPVTINVSVVAPDEMRSGFHGKIKIVNKDDTSDFCTIDVVLTTSKNKPFIFNFPLLNWLFERFPNVFLILRYLLGL